MALLGLFNRESKENLDKGLEKTKESMVRKLSRAVIGKSRVDDDVLDNLEEALISSDVGVNTTIKIIERIEQPVVGLNFVYKENTAVMVRNLSKAVIEKPKYHVALFNLDENINERSNPLPIPVAMGDYIRPEDGWGPNSMLSIPSVTKRVNSGDRLIGWALVTCPKCPIKYYWVYIL